MKKIDNDTERKVVQCMEEAVECANNGNDPSEAIAKVASKNKLTPPFVQRMVEAFNVSKTIAHLKQAEVDQRSNSFTLADFDTVINLMYPEKQAKEVKVAYDTRMYSLDAAKLTKIGTSITEFKLAKADVKPYDVRPEEAMENLIDLRQEARQLVKSAKLERDSAIFGLNRNISEICNHFSYISHENEKEFAERALCKYSVVATPILQMIKEHSGVDLPTTGTHSNKLYPDRKPYTLMDGAIDAASKLAEYTEVINQAEKHLRQIESMVVAPEKHAGEGGAALDNFFSEKEGGLIDIDQVGKWINQFQSLPESAREPAVRADIRDLDPFMSPRPVPRIGQLALPPGAYAMPSPEERYQRERQRFESDTGRSRELEGIAQEFEQMRDQQQTGEIEGRLQELAEVSTPEESWVFTPEGRLDELFGEGAGRSFQESLETQGQPPVPTQPASEKPRVPKPEKQKEEKKEKEKEDVWKTLDSLLGDRTSRKPQGAPSTDATAKRIKDLGERWSAPPRSRYEKLIDEMRNFAPDIAGEKQKALDKLYDPSNELNMRRWRAQVDINDMMTGDPIISSYPLNDVLQAYNELTSLMPRVVEQPIILRSLLRKILTTDVSVDEFTAKQMLDIEKGVGETRKPEGPGRAAPIKVPAKKDEGEKS